MLIFELLGAMFNKPIYATLPPAVVTLCAVVATSVCARSAERSSTAPPQDAIILFDGSNQDAWLSQVYKKWEESDGPADWNIVEGGVLEVVPNAGSLITRQKFGDIIFHFEFRLPKGEINGGVFLQARYEFGIKGSSGAPQGEACGSFENLRRPVRPSAKVLTAPNEWQTVDIDFRAPRFDEHGRLTARARATVRLNGVLIHDDVELGDRKGAAKRLGDAAIGPIMLQDHGQTYQFRNIWIIDKSAG
jgi:hypothetical protein